MKVIGSINCITLSIAALCLFGFCVCTSCQEREQAEAAELAEISGPQKIMRMLETLRSFRRREFKPSLRVNFTEALSYYMSNNVGVK